MKNAEFCGGEPCAVLPPQRAASAASHGAKNLCSTQPQLRHMAQNNICSAAPQCRFQPKQSSGVRSLSCVRWRETIFVARRIAPSGRRGTNHLPQGQPRSAPACPRRGNGSRRGTVGPSAQGKTDCRGEAADGAMRRATGCNICAKTQLRLRAAGVYAQ